VDIFALTRGDNLDTSAQSRPLRGQNPDVFAPCAPPPDIFALARDADLDIFASQREKSGYSRAIFLLCMARFCFVFNSKLTIGREMCRH
jgi:hypothetical protein